MKALPFTFKFHPWNKFPSYWSLLSCVKMSDMKSLTKWSFSLPWLHYMVDAFVTLLKSSTEASITGELIRKLSAYFQNLRSKFWYWPMQKSCVSTWQKAFSSETTDIISPTLQHWGSVDAAVNQPEWHHKCVEPEHYPPSLVQAEPDFSGFSGKHFRKQMNKFSAGNRNVLHSQSHVLYEEIRIKIQLLNSKVVTGLNYCI